MALEIPNGIVCAAVIGCNPGVDQIHPIYALRSSVGVLSTQNTVLPGGGFGALALTMMNPVIADEGCIVSQSNPVSDDGTSPISIASVIKEGPGGVPSDYDLLDDNVLVVAVVDVIKFTRASIAVLHLLRPNE